MATGVAPSLIVYFIPLAFLLISIAILFCFCTAATDSSARHLTSDCGAEIHANVQVVRQLQDLESHFTSMLTIIRRVYANCDLKEIQFFLDDLLGTDEFGNCDTFDNILRQLRQNHVDTFNIYYLEKLTAHFQNDEVDKLINEYNVKKEAFLKETAVVDFHQAIMQSVGPTLPTEKAAITIKIPHSLANKRTLKDMESLAGHAFGEYHESFVCLHVKPGSIIITWFFPKRLTEELEQLAKANEAVFKQAGVEEVTLAGKVVFLGNSEEVGS